MFYFHCLLTFIFLYLQTKESKTVYSSIHYFSFIYYVTLFGMKNYNFYLFVNSCHTFNALHRNVAGLSKPQKVSMFKKAANPNQCLKRQIQINVSRVTSKLVVRLKLNRRLSFLFV